MAIEPAVAIVHHNNPFIKSGDQETKDQSRVHQVPATVAIYPAAAVPLIQPLAYIHSHSYAYPYNLVAIGTA